VLDIPEIKKPISYFVMSDEQLADICRVAGEAGGNAAIKKYRETVLKARKKIADKRYHNTELLLENYLRLKLSAEKAIYDIQQIEEEQSIKQILDLMMDNDDADILIQSVKKSKAKTAVILKHIDTMLQVYKSLCTNSHDPLEERRYNILMDRYIISPTLSALQISEKYYLSERTVYEDIKSAKNTLSTLIFGIDGVFSEDRIDDAETV